MKYDLTTNTDGQVTLNTPAAFRPPLGLVLPAGQETRADITTATPLSSLISASHPTLPEGTQAVTGTDVYVYSGMEWLDQTTEAPAGTASISGVIILRNNADYDIGITW
jgi:hypothetical protein